MKIMYGWIALSIMASILFLSLLYTGGTAMISYADSLANIIGGILLMLTLVGGYFLVILHVKWISKTIKKKDNDNEEY